MDPADDEQRQAEEFEALSSIYGDDLLKEGSNEGCQLYTMKIRNEIKGVDLTLFLKIPPSYPSQAPPIFEISCAHLDGSAKQILSERFQEIYIENLGQAILFLWFEAARRFLDEHFLDEGKVITEPECALPDQPGPASGLTCDQIDPSTIQSGDPVTDRKSTFQAHLAPVLTKDDVQAVLAYLKTNPKLARATHNMYAYRIYDGRICIQDCNDDGENQAGSRLLHLLEMMDVRNVLIVVSRWYGGIHLGPDRFKHISNVARNVLEKSGYGKQQSTEQKKAVKRK